ncbi:hypothetical protein OIU91_10130 [Streptomyces sp. NBC_01456]|uniref:hypothetical protein n=1 Tax=unclassified Streptomyces TaxID=2593676 RepID=UPI002E3606D0|nr:MULTISPECIES: hypothetical protein [unclassified Streptomyces]
MTDLRIERVDGEAAIRDWQHVHNAIIPTAVLSLDDVRERVRRNQRRWCCPPTPRAWTIALAHGFAEVERYLLPGDSIPWITLRLA